MHKYLIKRFLMLIPTMLGITLICFFIMNLAPGGPIDQQLQRLQFGGGGGDTTSTSGGSSSNGSQTVSNEVLEAMKKQYGFDKPVHMRYLLWLKNLVKLDFGESFTYEEPVIDVIISKLPVSLQFGVISFILTYLISVPLGILKALKNGTNFDKLSSLGLFVTYSIPPLMLGILMIVFLSGKMDLFPIGGIYSDMYDELGFFEKIIDRIHHFILPLTCYMIGGFASLTMLMKNSLLDVVKLDYIRTARAKGLEEKVVIMKHALRNSLIPIATGLGSFFSVFFAGSLIIEQIFQLDGIGLLGYNSILSRDYNVLMGSLTIQSFLMLFGNIVSDTLYTVIDPRLDFE